MFLENRGDDMTFLDFLPFLVIAIFVSNVIFAGFVVFFERRNPASSWAWLLVLFFIPLFGFIIYMVFGRNSKREKMFIEKEKYDNEVYYRYLFFKDYALDQVRLQKKIISKKQQYIVKENLDDLVFLHINAGSWVTTNNTIKHFIDGQSKFDTLIEDIRQAKKFIHLEYYILRGDDLGKKIVHELALKAKEGVEVRLLYDGMGCTRLPRHFFQELEQNGGYTAAFLPRFLIRLNYRDHRKLCIIDGEIGYIGGFNIGNEYLGIVKRYGAWRDTHLRIKGDAVDQLQIRFMMDWNFTSSNATIALEDKYFPYREQTQGVKIQIVSSGPDTVWKNIWNGYFKMITEAEKHIYIQTPYFVPDDGILEALRVAALSGIDVRIIIPGNPDHFFVYWASMSYLGELLEAGVRCYQYEKGFIHTKAVFIDGEICSIGTANMDIRSFDLNFEVNAFLYDKETTVKLEQDFLNDLENCVEITKEWYVKRKWWFRVKESVSRLISPML